MQQLQALQGVIPPGSSTVDANAQEPSWIGSCDDQYFTRGWSEMGFVFEFHSNLSRPATLSYITHRMSQLGWGRRSG